MSAVVVVLTAAYVLMPSGETVAQGTPVAFSAKGEPYFSQGPADSIGYSVTLSNAGGAWDGTGFKVPVDGWYFFSIEFVKDAVYYENTHDDVYVYLRTTVPGQSPKNRATAWSGQISPKTRETGAVSVVLKLTANTYVSTAADSDSGRPRYIPHLYFTGFLLR